MTFPWNMLELQLAYKVHELPRIILSNDYLKSLSNPKTISFIIFSNAKLV